MSALRIIGVDPGPVPGLSLLWVDDSVLLRAEVMQCTAGLAAEVLDALLLEETGPVLVQTETFVAGRRAGRSSTAGAGAVTRDLVGQLQRVVDAWGPSASRDGARFVQRPAGAVKPWATDTRLEKSGLLDLCKGMRHARDAARHALFAAVHEGALPDPLSNTWRT